MTNDLELGPLVQATPNTVLPDFTPRCTSVLTGEFPEARIAGLALTLERELQVQTDLANHWKAKAKQYWQTLDGEGIAFGEESPE